MAPFKLQVALIRALGLLCLGLSTWFLAQLGGEDTASGAWWTENWRLVAIVLVGAVGGLLTVANPGRFVERMLIAQKRRPKGLDNLPWWVMALALLLVGAAIVVYRDVVERRG